MKIKIICRIYEEAEIIRESPKSPHYRFGEESIVRLYIVVGIPEPIPKIVIIGKNEIPISEYPLKYSIGEEMYVVDIGNFLRMRKRFELEKDGWSISTE